MSGEKETVVNGGFGPCQDMYDRFLNCMTFGGQLRHMRREGSAENCGDLITDYSRCLMAQASHNEVRKKASLLIFFAFLVKIHL